MNARARDVRVVWMHCCVPAVFQFARDGRLHAIIVRRSVECFVVGLPTYIDVRRFQMFIPA